MLLYASFQELLATLDANSAALSYEDAICSTYGRFVDTLVGMRLGSESSYFASYPCAYAGLADDETRQKVLLQMELDLKSLWYSKARSGCNRG
jgi:hypothetical protein